MVYFSIRVVEVRIYGGCSPIPGMREHEPFPTLRKACRRGRSVRLQVRIRREASSLG